MLKCEDKPLAKDAIMRVKRHEETAKMLKLADEYDQLSMYRVGDNE